MFKKKNKLLNHENSSNKYSVFINKGDLGLVLEYDEKSKTYVVDQVIRNDIKDQIQEGDILIKINNKDISNFNTQQISKYCKKNKDKSKELQFIHIY